MAIKKLRICIVGTSPKKGKLMEMRVTKMSLWMATILMLNLMDTALFAETNSQNPVANHLLVAETAAEARDNSFFSYEGRKTYSTAAIPTTVLAADDPNREVVWGGVNTRVEIYLFDVDPKESYKMELTLLSDSNDCVVTVNTHHYRLLEEEIALPYGKPLTRRWLLPPESYQSGRIFVEVRPVGCPSAPVTAMKLFCSNPNAQLPVPNPPKPSVIVTAGRITPRPVCVQDVQTPAISLCGTWRFNPSVEGEFWNDPSFDASIWKPIEVPGQWFMQGFTVDSDKTAGYQRDFMIPADWTTQRVKLRCDGVYSDARVWINGHEAGTHEGGTTPFELDVTDFVRFGQSNSIVLSVRSSGTKSDSLLVGNLYTGFDNGGITRKVTLFAVPAVNIALLDVTTTFDKTYTDAQLTLDLEVANEGSVDMDSMDVKFALSDPLGEPVDLNVSQFLLGTIKHGAMIRKTINIPVVTPKKWDCEHPNLYKLVCELGTDGQTLESTSRRVGFRQIEIQGKQFLINGVPVKLHGASRHEAHPTRCRVLTPDFWRRDVELFRECNMNYVRTTHYPPAEEFLDACDELGLFVESEGPFCFSGGTALEPDEVPNCITLPLLEMVKFNRNHPSVILWSLANETDRFRDYFQNAADAVKAADPTRPRNLSGSPNVGNDNGYLEISSPHYPGLDGTTIYSKESRPTMFDEFLHLNCYNRSEMVTDPGLRDIWGFGVAEMWKRTYASPDIMGGTLWGAVDEMFYAPGGKTFGFGPWGVFDGWRRPKPEFWHIKKIYSPIHIAEHTLQLIEKGKNLQIPVQNRYDFSNLDEVRFTWTLDDQSGTTTVSVAPHSAGTLVIPVKQQNLKGKALLLAAYSPDGMMIDTWRLPIGEQSTPEIVEVVAKGKVTLERTTDLLTVRAGEFVWNIDARTGMIREVTSNGKPLLIRGPTLMLLPVGPPPPFGNLSGTATYPSFTNPCSDWKASNIYATDENDKVEIRVEGEYKEAKGTFVMLFGDNGNFALSYAFTVQTAIKPRQIGVVFDLPCDYDRLSWRRKAQWSVYPDNHIGRPIGTAKAFPRGVNVEGMATPRIWPDWPWSQDANKLGSNDFRSTKMNIFEAALHAEDGLAVRAVSNGSQHARAWVDGDRICFLVADYTNEGGASFFNERVIPVHSLTPDCKIQGKINLCLRDAMATQ